MPHAVDAQIDQLLTEPRRVQLSIAQVRAIADRAFELGLFVQSMEVFEILSPTRQPLRTNLSILGLDKDWDVRARCDAAFARRVLAEKLEAAEACPNLTVCEIWLDQLQPCS